VEGKHEAASGCAGERIQANGRKGGEQARRTQQAGAQETASAQRKCGERVRERKDTSKRVERWRAEVVQMEVQSVWCGGEIRKKGERGRKNREFCVNGALCSGLIWQCRFASDTFTNTYVAVYYREFRVSLSKSFVSILKFLSAICLHYCFYVPLVLVSSLSCCSFGRSPESTHSGDSHRSSH
jgi:hypothetical protein